MSEIRIPQHVIKRLERRRAGKLEQRAGMRMRVQSLFPPQAPRPIEQDDPLRSPHVARWLANSLRPPSDSESV
jgi:hypothetical protein